MCKSGFIWLFLLAISTASCENKTVLNSHVKHKSALLQTMSGNLEAPLPLDSLPGLPAPCALERLEEEIQIFKSGSRASKSIAARNVGTEPTCNHKAALLAYAQLPPWSSSIRAQRFSKHSALEKQIKAADILQRAAIEKPHPFLLKETTPTLEWHIINWIKGGAPHTYKKLKGYGSKGPLKNSNLNIIGLYSERHRTIITHHPTFQNLPFKTDVYHVVAGRIGRLKSDQLKPYFTQT